MQASRAEAEKDGVVVPTTMEEYCMKPKTRPPSSQDNIEMDEFYDDCYDMDDDDEDEEDEEDIDVEDGNQERDEDAEDSGNGEC